MYVHVHVLSISSKRIINELPRSETSFHAKSSCVLLHQPAPVCVCMCMYIVVVACIVRTHDISFTGSRRTNEKLYFVILFAVDLF